MVILRYNLEETMTNKMIKLKKNTIDILKALKIAERESYDEVINRILLKRIAEEELELNDNVKEALKERIELLNQGRVSSFEDILEKFRQKKRASKKENRGTRGDKDAVES